MIVRTAIRRAPTAAPRLRRPLLVLAVALASLAATVGARAVAQRWTAPPAAAAATTGFPSNPSIEQRWGIRITAVNLLADGGIVELRYTVLNDGMTGRIHSGKAADLPTLHSDATGADINGSTVVMHIHTDNSGDQAGHNFSILYGNANGAIHPGSEVTVVMPDGLRLGHVPVAR